MLSSEDLEAINGWLDFICEMFEPEDLSENGDDPAEGKNIMASIRELERKISAELMIENAGHVVDGKPSHKDICPVYYQVGDCQCLDTEVAE